MLQKNSVQENKTRAVSDLAGDSIKKWHVVTLQNALNLCNILTLFWKLKASEKSNDLNSLRVAFKAAIQRPFQKSPF